MDGLTHLMRLEDVEDAWNLWHWWPLVSVCHNAETCDLLCLHSLVSTGSETTAFSRPALLLQHWLSSLRMRTSKHHHPQVHTVSSRGYIYILQFRNIFATFLIYNLEVEWKKICFLISKVLCIIPAWWVARILISGAGLSRAGSPGHTGGSARPGLCHVTLYLI